MRYARWYVLAFLLVLAASPAALRAQCANGQVVADTCDGATWEGCCSGGAVRWCSGQDGTGVLCEWDCAAEGQVCTWANAYYWCEAGPEVVAGPPEFPLSCCDPQCEGKACGADDGCGGLCTGPDVTCPDGKVCAPDGVCCQPQCDGKQCGVDGCGGECGACGCGERCVNGACQFALCDGRACGDVGCGGSCGACPDGQVCAHGTSCCTPSCDGKACGDDGCGGTCGACACGERCVAGACQFQACDGLACGPDGCGGTCGECAPEAFCHAGQCVTEWFCTPSWQGSSDGCDCNCGAYDPDCDADSTPYGCTPGQGCDATGHCIDLPCVASCDGKVCGDDGCGGSCGACPADQNCHEGQCVTGWFCTYGQGTGDGCDCECGAYDPDCDTADGWIAGCQPWQTCDHEGHCRPDVCPPSCAGKACGDDGCGGSCGGCPLDQPSCVDGACQADGCGGVTEVGCCAGDVLRSCSTWSGLQATDCAAQGQVCGWDAAGYPDGAYACGLPDDPYGSVDPAGDPSGAHPMACPACTPQCAGKACGASDGCGGACGCPAGLHCVGGQCLACIGQCYAAECGDDGCGGTCGTCDAPAVCAQRQCCVPACDGKTCGDDGCGGTCGACEAGLACFEGQCCTPTCDGVTCGNDDGCGGTCGCSRGTCVDGACQGGCGGITFEGCCDGSITWWCQDGQLQQHDCATDGSAGLCGWSTASNYYWCGETTDPDPSGQFPYMCPGACTPDCECKPCGTPDGCHGVCGCEAGQTCEDGQCVACEPSCLGRTCGDDGCGGTCGECEAGLTCHEYGVCVDPCQGIGFEGCCQDEQALWCNGGSLGVIDCAEQPLCGWNGGGFYDCGTDGSADPTGTVAKECPEACVPDCRERECGHDGCGGMCGACDDGLLCQDGLCATPVEPDAVEAVDTVSDTAADPGGTDPGGTDPGTDPGAADVASDTTAGDVPAADVPASTDANVDSATPDEGGGRDEGGGGGCTTGGSHAGSFGLLLALAGLLLLVRRRVA